MAQWKTIQAEESPANKNFGNVVMRITASSISFLKACCH